MMKTNIEKLLRYIPGYAAAQEAMRAESVANRAALIAQVRRHRDAADRAQADVDPVAGTLQARAAKLRQQLAAVEAELSAKLAVSGSARWCADNAIRDLQKQLREDAHPQVREFLSSIDLTRAALHANLGYARNWVLVGETDDPVTNERVVAALALLLQAHLETGLVAAEEADVEAAIAGLRERLSNAGVRLLDSSMLLNLVPPPAKAPAYIQ